MHRLRDFLKVKYDTLRPEIKAKKQAGVLVERCFFCDFEAAPILDAGEPLFEGQCLVCGSHRASLHVPCPKCTRTIIVEDLAEGKCEGCKEDIDVEYLIEEFGPNTDPKEEPETAYCSDCERTDTHTVIPHGEEYLCLSCLNVHQFVDHCGNCYERWTGINSVDTSVFGCMLCRGAMRDD
jgi:hypothetical protein